MRDCYNCKKYETEGECIECKFEPKDEPQDECAKEYEELGLKELKELIEADRKTEPQTDLLVKTPQKSRDSHEIAKTEPQTEVDWKQRLCDMYGADRKSFDEAWQKYEADKVEDEPQTDCAWREP